MAARGAARYFDYLVIGGGSGGLGSGRRAALRGKKVAIIEHGKIGGTCVSLLLIACYRGLTHATLLSDVANPGKHMK